MGIKQSLGDVDGRSCRVVSSRLVLDTSILLRSSICAIPDTCTPSALLIIQHCTITIGLLYRHLRVGNSVEGCLKEATCYRSYDTGRRVRVTLSGLVVRPALAGIGNLDGKDSGESDLQ